MKIEVTRWHAGKLIIIWGMGGVASGIALMRFLSGSVVDSPIEHLIALLIALLILLGLTAITWHWLTGRERV